jgi:hypothetical protein
VLKRSEKGWQVAADHKTFYTADSSAVDALFETLANLKGGSAVSSNPERHALYEVSLENGVQVEALGPEGTLANLLIGKSGPNIFSTYVRAADSEEVYLVDGILQAKFSRELNDWRDKTIFMLNPGMITAYTVSGDSELALQKKDGTWQAGGTAVSTAAVEKVLEAFTDLSAAGFADGAQEEFGLDEPLRIITVELANGTQAALLAGKDKNAFQQYAKTDHSDTVYIIEKHLLGMLCPTLEELAEPEKEEETPAEPAEENKNKEI